MTTPDIGAERPHQCRRQTRLYFFTAHTSEGPVVSAAVVPQLAFTIRPNDDELFLAVHISAKHRLGAPTDNEPAKSVGVVTPRAARQSRVARPKSRLLIAA
jgi:hypothetical protein